MEGVCRDFRNDDTHILELIQTVEKLQAGIAEQEHVVTGYQWLYRNQRRMPSN